MAATIAMENGEPISTIEQKITRLHSVASHVKLA